MGFIGDIGSKIGGVFGFGGGANTFRANAPNIDFTATPGAQSNYGGTIDQSAANALGAYGQGQQSRAGQQSFLDVLRDRMMGNGPSVAEQLLKRQTDQNIQQAAGQMASARGLNPGLAARLVAQNAAATQQGAAGQGALLRAQEQTQNANLLGSGIEAQRGQDIAQQQAATGLFGAAGGLQNAQNAGLLGVQGLNQQTAAQNAANNLESQRINASVAAQNADISSKAWGGLLNAGGAAAATAAGFAEGGEVPYYLSPTVPAFDPLAAYVDPAHTPIEPSSLPAPEQRSRDKLPPLTGSLATAPSNIPAALRLGTPLDYLGLQPTQLGGFGGLDKLGKGGGAEVAKALPALLAARGGAIPGRAPVQGNSPRNDSVPAMLSPGEIVLPRSVAQASDAPVEAEAFVKALKKHRSGPKGFAAVLQKTRDLHNRLARLEAKVG